MYPYAKLLGIHAGWFVFWLCFVVLFFFYLASFNTFCKNSTRIGGWRWWFIRLEIHAHTPRCHDSWTDTLRQLCFRSLRTSFGHILRDHLRWRFVREQWRSRDYFLTAFYPLQKVAAVMWVWLEYSELSFIKTVEFSYKIRQKCQVQANVLLINEKVTNKAEFWKKNKLMANPHLFLNSANSETNLKRDRKN